MSRLSIKVNYTRYSSEDILVLADLVEVAVAKSLKERVCSGITIDYMAKPKPMGQSHAAYTNVEANQFRERHGVLRIVRQNHFPGTELEKLAAAKESAVLPKIVVEHILVRLASLLFDVSEYHVFGALFHTNRMVGSNGNMGGGSADQLWRNLRKVFSLAETCEVRILDKPEEAKPKKSEDQRAKIYVARLKAMDTSRKSYICGLKANLEWMQKATDKMQAVKSKAEGMGLNVDYEITPLSALLAPVTKDVK